MMRTLTVVALLLLAGLPLAAAGHPVTMWQVEGETNRVYLLGSVHLLRERDHPLPEAIDAAYADAESLIMELDMDDLDAAVVQTFTNRLGIIQDERTLRDLMGEARYAEAAAAAEALDIPIEMLSKAEPWYAAITVEQLVLMRIGFNPLYGVELYMTRLAQRDGKPIEGLETIEEQLGFLDSLSPDAQNDLLIQTLEEGGEISVLMDDMIRAWRTGDTEYLEDTILAEMARYPEVYDAIVVQRNRRWADAIAGLLDDDDDYLVIVGALHLIGEDGLPAMLEERGITTGQMHEPL
jgi:uncharacterized protein YbaP (TraB family)